MSDYYPPVTPESIERAKVAAQRERDELNAVIFPRYGAYVDRQGRYFRDRLNIVISERGRASSALLLLLALMTIATISCGIWIDATMERATHPRNWPIASPSR